MFLLLINKIKFMFKSFIIVLENHQWGQQLASEACESAKKHGWNLEKFKAVDGRNSNMDKCLARYNLKLFTKHKKQVASMKRPGVFGNLLSHYNLWKLCSELNEPIGCFEHDVLFQNSPTLIDMSFTNLCRLDKLKLQKNYSTGQCWNGAHAYILKPEGARRLLNWSHTNGVMGADIMIGTDVVDIAFDTNQLVIFNPKQELDEKGYSPYSTSKTMTF
jgi:GR25 family glycosyltransferase involved in LPS biosynthesis